MDPMGEVSCIRDPFISPSLVCARLSVAYGYVYKAVQLKGLLEPYTPLKFVNVSPFPRGIFQVSYEFSGGVIRG